MASEFNSSTTIADGEQYTIDGLNIWEYNWNDTKERITITEPSLGHGIKVPVYEIIKDDLKVRFAAIERSNNVWLIYHKYL
jgi:hypothetical protein